MKTVNVVAAVICDSLTNKTKVLATARGYGDFKGMWEFPGGKIEAGETAVQALKREIKEELDVEIRVGDLICRTEYDYPAFHLSMKTFWCELSGGKLTFLEAENSAWLGKNELNSVNWLPADLSLIDIIKAHMHNETDGDTCGQSQKDYS